MVNGQEIRLPSPNEPKVKYQRRVLMHSRNNKLIETLSFLTVNQDYLFAFSQRANRSFIDLGPARTGNDYINMLICWVGNRRSSREMQCDCLITPSIVLRGLHGVKWFPEPLSITYLHILTIE